MNAIAHESAGRETTATTNEATAFAPPAVGNIGVGFDMLGHTFEAPGDVVTVRRTEDRAVTIISISGVTSSIPSDAARNTAGSALLALQNELTLPYGFEIELRKGIALASGMGGSAASAVAALVAANALLDEPLDRQELYRFAMTGESVASGGRHGDNVGAQLFGGVVIATARRVIPITVPTEWHCVVVHPEAVLETRTAREVLARAYELREFVAQSENLALVLTGCQRGDASLVREGLSDVLVEPRRAQLIAGFYDVKAAAISCGALGSSISGAGPSVFAWFESERGARDGAPAMVDAFARAGVAAEAFVSPIAGPRAELIG